MTELIKIKVKAFFIIPIPIFNTIKSETNKKLGLSPIAQSSNPSVNIDDVTIVVFLISVKLQGIFIIRWIVRNFRIWITTPLLGFPLVIFAIKLERDIITITVVDTIDVVAAIAAIAAGVAAACCKCETEND